MSIVASATTPFTMNDTEEFDITGVAPSEQHVAVWCPVPSINDFANNAVMSLYYLPHYVSLMLPKALAADSAKFGSLPFANRIQFYDSLEKSSSPDEFLFTAVLREGIDTDAEEGGWPVVAVSGRSASPEGIASALLRKMRG